MQDFIQAQMGQTVGSVSESLASHILKQVLAGQAHAH